MLRLAFLFTLLPLPAAAFCVVNDGDRPVTVSAGGGPMPVWYQPALQPGQRACHVPRRTDVGITVEVSEGAGPVKCRLSVPAKDATIIVGAGTCRVQVR